MNPSDVSGSAGPPARPPARSPLATLRPHAVNVYLGPGVLALRRGLHRLGRRGRRRVFAYLQIDDPYSVLLAQVLPDMAASFDVDVVVRHVPAPDAAFTPDAEHLASWALRDAVELAAEWGLQAPSIDRPPTADEAAAAASALGPEPTLQAFADVGQRLWSGGFAGQDGTAPDLRAAQDERRRRGHYQGGMLWYEGEWFWGLDRLGLLQERLVAEGLPSPPPRPTFAPPIAPQEGSPPLEFFFSFRSPYSYLSVQPTIALAADLGVPLRIRPVLPMVMRGLSVPKPKVLYLARDCARLARQQGQPFGRIADPVGPGIANCLALFCAAEGPEQQAALVRSASRGIWSEALDATHAPHLRIIAERAGLPWDPAVDTAPGLALAEANRLALLELGLWGVPSYRYGAYTTWGQDRLPRLRRAIEGRG